MGSDQVESDKLVKDSLCERVSSLVETVRLGFIEQVLGQDTA